MSERAEAQRQFRAACTEVRRLVDVHSASLPAVLREAMELTAVLYLAQWAASLGTPDQEQAP